MLIKLLDLIEECYTTHPLLINHAVPVQEDLYSADSDIQYEKVIETDF
jgi:hypothetical protein